MDIGRRHDISEIHKERSKTKDSVMKVVLDKTEQKIKDEQSDSWMRSARDSMIYERLKDRQDNVRDIQDSILDRKKKNIVSSFSIRGEVWDRIYGKKN